MSPASPTVRGRRLALELKRLRGDKTFDQAAAATNGEISALSIRRYEDRQRVPRPGDLRSLLDAYGASGTDRDMMLALAREAKSRGWWDQYRETIPTWFGVYLGLEAEASICEYATELVPGLLQTEDYCRATLVAAGVTRDLDEHVAVRQERRKRVLGRDDADYWAVLNEAVLRRPVGGREVMCTQLEQLAEVAQEPGVTVLVLPFDSGAHPAMDGTFSLLRFPVAGDPDVVYLEHMGSSLYLEVPADTGRYVKAFDRLRAEAASPQRSLQMITDAAHGFHDE